MQKGRIGVTTDNIFPVIKKFLYSDQEIFLREVISNAVDATQKLKTLASVGEFKEELGDLSIRVSLNSKNKTLTVSDRGIGMTAEEIDKYINQIAFSGAEEFLEKYKTDANAIIGHFGLGFYSTFMVSSRVEIVTKSWKEGSKAVRWSCDGSPEYELEEVEKDDRGTDIILYIDNKDYLKEEKINELLNKYCKFLPIPIIFGKKKEWKDGKYQETDQDNQINETEPTWTKKPGKLKEEDYLKFYKDLYPFSEDPLFHIHLNVDYPFHLTGILYFPKIKNSIEIQRNKIQLYCNQVYVTDSVEGIVPNFLTLLHGVIDSPDIPLNVSRSYLQHDVNVKKISNHITKKVGDRLKKIFKDDRKQFEEKWDDLKIFIQYGILTEEKFWDYAKEFSLMQNIDGKYFTYEEYQTLIKEEQTDKDGQLIYLYASDKESQYAYIETAGNAGYDVLLMNGELDVPLMQHLEQKFEKSRFVRVDSDVIENLIQKKDREQLNLSEEEKESLKKLFSEQLPAMDKVRFELQLDALGENSLPIVLTQNEFMRRMQDMSGLQPGLSFYADMPVSYSMVLNTEHKLIKELIGKELDEKNKNTVNQLIDLALLSNGMLKGESLIKFIKRSCELI